MVKVDFKFMQVDGSSRFIADEIIEGLQVKDSDLSSWRFAGGGIQAGTLENSKADYWRLHRTKLQDVRFEHCRLENAFCHESRFEKVNSGSSFWDNSAFVNCDLIGTVAELSSWGLCSFSDTRLTGSRMSEVGFIGSFWQNCQLQNENYNFVRFPSSLFVDTTFADCMFKKVIFRRARFIRCKFENCKLPETVFHNAIFEDCTFEGTNLHEAGNIEGMKGGRL